MDRQQLPETSRTEPTLDRRVAARRFLRLARALGVGLMALAFAAGSAAASTQAPTGPGSISLATGSQTATVYDSIHDADHNVVTTVPVGSVVHMKLVVAGAGAIPTGQVIVRAYSGGTCSGTLVNAWTLNLSDGALGTLDAVTASMTSYVAATKSMFVQYFGDATFAGAVGACRPVTFTKIDPVIKLTIHDAGHEAVGSVPFTSQVHASVAMLGKVSQASGYVLVRGWANGTCSGSDYVFTTKVLDEATADSILPLGFDAPSMRSYKAHYSGDATYNGIWSDCVAVTATKIAPKLTLVLHDENHGPAPATALVPTAIHPAFAVSGAAGQPTGTVTIDAYIGACTTFIGQGSTPAVASFDDPAFKAAAPSLPLRFSWRATYSGDANYLPATSDCLGIQYLALPSVTLSIHDASHAAITSATVGSTIHLDATISGGFGTPTGKVDLKIATNSSCLNPTTLGTATLSSGVADDAAIQQALSSTGTVWFVAKYKGDGTYVPSTSACVALTVTAAPVVTAAPSGTPGPTGQPTAGPTGAPGASAFPWATGLPGSTPDAEATTDPSAPTWSADPSAGPSAAAASGSTGPVGGAASGGDAGPGLGLLAFVLVAGLTVLWVLVGRRRRRGPEPGPAVDGLSAARSS